MAKQLGLWSLVAVGIGSMIGSGWLFSAFKACKYAGGAAIFSWLIGALIAICLALTIAEIVTLHPKRGLFTRLLTISHNRDMGYITALANWLGIVAVIPTEAMATVQYIIGVKKEWASLFYYQHHLTAYGLSLVTLLVLFYGLINYFGTKLFAKSNNAITLFKIIVPIATSLTIIYTSYHPSNFVAEHHTLIPYGLNSIFAATISSGIIYAFNGFQSIASFSSEVKSPHKTVPKALIISIIATLCIYLLLQVAFIGGLPTASLKDGYGGLAFKSPIADLSALLGLNFMTMLLYVDACVSPTGTGIIYTGTTCRMLTAMSQEGQAPKYFDKIHPVYHFSRRSLVFNLLLSILLIWFFPSWQSLVIIVSLFHIISYMACPIALMRLRLIENQAERHYKMPAASILCPLLFVFVSFLYAMSPLKNILTVTLLLVLLYGNYVFVFNQGKRALILSSIKQSYPLILYFILIALLDLAANPDGGLYAKLSKTEFYGLISALAFIFYYWLVYSPPISSTSKLSLSNVQKSPQDMGLPSK